MNKTKLVAPWNLKVGQKLIQCDAFNKLRQGFTIIKINKKTGYFTGKTIWYIWTDNPLWDVSTFHGKGRTLPYQKAEIQIN